MQKVTQFGKVGRPLFHISDSLYKQRGKESQLILLFSLLHSNDVKVMQLTA